MNLSAVLEVVIGLVLLYYALGLIVNAIVGTVKEVFDMRAEALEQVLVKFLETEGDKLALFNRFKNSPLIQSLKPLAPKLRQIKNRADPKISEIPNPTFALAILEALSSEHLVLIGVQRGIGELAKGVAAGDQTTQALLNSLVDIGDQQRLVEGMQKAIGQIPDKNIQERLKNLVTVLLGTPAQQLDVIRAGIRGLPEGIAKKALTGLIDFSVTDIDEARKRIEAWYDNLMQNVSQLFTKNVQRIVIGVSLAVTLIIGTDTIYVARVLWEQPSLRAAIAAAVP